MRAGAVVVEGDGTAPMLANLLVRLLVDSVIFCRWFWRWGRITTKQWYVGYTDIIVLVSASAGLVFVNLRYTKCKLWSTHRVQTSANAVRCSKAYSTHKHSSTTLPYLVPKTPFSQWRRSGKIDTVPKYNRLVFDQRSNKVTFHKIWFKLQIYQ